MSRIFQRLHQVQHLCVNCRSLSTTRQMADFSRLADRFKGLETNIWVAINNRVAIEKPLNMGQGFPDFAPPDNVVEALKKAACGEKPLLNQYTRSFGHPRLIQALSKVYSPILKHELDPMTEILCTLGAYEALFVAFNGLVNEGDEVVIIEPFFDCYEPMARAVGAVPRFVPLRPTKTGQKITSDDWKLDPEEFRSKMSPKTKVLVLNTPNNPIGKIYSREELEMIAEECIKNDVIVISDEVYEWLIYPGREHIKIATLPGMWDRTVTIGSAGKTFSVTGWKLGWAVGPKHLVQCLAVVHQNSVYTCPTIIQEAVAIAFEDELARIDSPDCYLRSIATEMLPKRDLMVREMEALGMNPTVPEGGYFILGEISKFDPSVFEDGSDATLDTKFNNWMMKHKKLAGIPPSNFYTKEDQHLGEKYLRFCFCKKDETLNQAAAIFRGWKTT